ncbi:hypothetical protein L6R52_22295 [Myxococcota bacterium]|nr:hypothetical protein [Myxococcota bacterium]
MSLAKKLLIALGAVVGLFVVAFVVLVLVVDVDAFARKARDATVASLTDTLGRDVTLGEVDATIFPKLGMRATDLRVAGTTASAAPLVEARALRATISLWDVIESLGKDVRVAEIVVTEPVLHVERDANGRFPDAAILERLSDRDGAPLDPATIERIERARIDRLVVERGRVVFVDHSVTREGAELVLAPIALEVTNLGLGLAPHVELDVGVADRARVARRHRRRARARAVRAVDRRAPDRRR